MPYRIGPVVWSGGNNGDVPSPLDQVLNQLSKKLGGGYGVGREDERQQENSLPVAGIDIGGRFAFLDSLNIVSDLREVYES